MPIERPVGRVEWLVRLAVVLAIVGLVLTLVFLVFGFHPVTMGLGVFIGAPLLLAAIALYLLAVVIDLRKRGVFEKGG